MTDANLTRPVPVRAEPATKRYFGTDGIRGRVGTFPATAEFVLKLGWAVGRVLGADCGSKVLIGKDTRISGYMFESALEAGLSSAGVDILLSGPMPTPAIAYLTRTLHACAGIVISASHNPYYDNGIKLFSSDGTKFPDELELAIEDALALPFETVDAARLGRAERVADAAGRYIEFCKSTIPHSIDLRGMTVVVDCANGASYHVAPSVFDELGANVIGIGVEPDGLNINAECGATAPQALRDAVLEHQADLGIALDGDGDRLILVDHLGEIVDGDEALYILARFRKERGMLSGAVVGTVMSNLGLEHALRDHGIDFHRTPVGDRYIMEMLQEKDWTLGGESSGHIICLDRSRSGDGIVSALQVLWAMRETGRSLHDIKAGMTKYPQHMVNVRVASNGAPPCMSDGVQDAVRAAESQLAGRGRVLLRPSGTEPLIRVMVEGADAGQVERLARELAQVVERELARSGATPPA
ncbi:MAG: phosphoglucosamine mutase [Chromatiales bacterium 21-64-14]|nr:MAG: phosphoglucosamine mutase [Chromatiales bacterium 21-64-14]HQU15433.1 phosphoglucosamine mutase [Gammaproteobacteria bacterium]